MNCPSCFHLASSLMMALALTSVDTPSSQRFNQRNIKSCTFVHTCPWYEILSRYDLYCFNGSHFSLFLQLSLLHIWLIIDPSYFTQMYIDTRAKHVKITGSWWQNWSNLWTFFSLPYVWLLNSDISKLHTNLNLHEVRATLILFVIQRLTLYLVAKCQMRSG